MSVDGVNLNTQKATIQPKFQIAQAYPTGDERRENLTNKIAAILSSQTGDLHAIMSGQRQQNGNYNTSVVYDTSIGQQPHLLGKVAISVTKTPDGWSGKFQLYSGGGAPPEVLKFHPAPYSSAPKASTSADFAAEMVKALREKRYDLFDI